MYTGPCLEGRGPPTAVLTPAKCHRVSRVSTSFRLSLSDTVWIRVAPSLYVRRRVLWANRTTVRGDGSVPVCVCVCDIWKLGEMCLCLCVIFKVQLDTSVCVCVCVCVCVFDFGRWGGCVRARARATE